VVKKREEAWEQEKQGQEVLEKTVPRFHREYSERGWGKKTVLGTHS